MVNEDLIEKGRFELLLDGIEGMSHIDIWRKNIRGNSQCKGSSVTGKGMRSLCATVKVCFDFALSHLGIL